MCMLYFSVVYKTTTAAKRGVFVGAEKGGNGGHVFNVEQVLRLLLYNNVIHREKL